MPKRGYYQTANKHIPHNDRAPGTIAKLALRQLAAYQRVARNWSYYTMGRCKRCSLCHQNIYFTEDENGVVYQYTTEEILALFVAHIRQNHEGEVSTDGIR